LESAADARLEIEEALTAPAAEASPQRESSRLAWVIAAAAALIAVGLGLVHFREVPASAPSEMRTEIITPAASDPVSFALSPDGKQIVYAAPGDAVSHLWLRSLDNTIAQPLVGTNGAAYPFWSPDSRSIGFFADGKLKRLDIGTGQPQTLVNAVGGRGGSWNAEGIILFASGTAGPLSRIAAAGGDAVPVTKLVNHTSHRFPQFLPGGRQFLFFAMGAPETQGIYLGLLDSAETQRLTAADTAGAYLVPGWLAWVQAGTLRAQRLDVARRERSGDPVTLADPVAFDVNVYLGAFSVSAAGLVAYRPGGGAIRRQLAWFDRTGKSLGTLGAPDENGLSAPRISPDGRRVAVYRTGQGNADVWLLDSARTTRFTFDAAFDRFPVWSPDGSRLVFDSNRKGSRNLYIKSAGGAGDEMLLVESAQDKIANDWSGDGRFILFHSIDPQSNRDLWVAPLEGDRKPWVFLKTNFDERAAQFSPDGRWVAYESNESGRFEINVRPFAPPGGSVAGRGGGQWQVSTAGGTSPAWRPD
jgi:Tol biopolymer transport system component